MRRSHTSCFIAILMLEDCSDKVFQGPVHRRKGREFFEFMENSKKSPMGKDENKMHSKFYRDETNGSWFKIRGTNG